MNNREDFKLHGAMTVVLRKGNGEIEVTHKDNAIVASGFDFVCDALAKSVGRPGVLSHIAVGTGTNAVNATTDSALQTQLGARIAATYNHVAGTKVFTIACSLAAGTYTGAITESGVFNDPAAGIMLDRVVFPVVNKGADDSMDITFTFTLS
ncbi:hypothetical protein [Cupriavidus campinensis]|uniref:DUF4402 domain-containing protein n=1 Tax=Cupriavidus campinensis TaxID=151783 RepID=A0ABY3ESK8_9BURK|nr:hypothetical protein [Cupriavidus campinensis]TSP13959.1 hypothetical protein FGG12_05670 [Cupriavidus campinensis]